MLSNAFRSVCRLRNAAAFEQSYASFASLGRLSDSPSHQGSIVEKLLLTPSITLSDGYPTAYSISIGSPLSSLGSPSEAGTDWSLEDEKSFDTKFGIYELDSLLCDDFGDVESYEEAVQSCRRVKREDKGDDKNERSEVITNASFHSFIDDLIATVKDEIDREQALEEAVLLERAATASDEAATLAAASAAPLSIKNQHAGLDGSANNRKRISSDTEESYPVLRKRKRLFTLEEMALRKRNQNRRAAQRYREKLVKVKEEQVGECTELEEKNDGLRVKIADLENEIERFKTMLLTRAEEAKKEL